MPDHFYTGAPGRCVALRDAAGLPVNDVEPGDIRPFEGPPDAWWLPVEGNEDHAAHQARRDREAAAQAAVQDGAGDESGDSPADEPLSVPGDGARKPRTRRPSDGTATAGDADASGQTPEEQP
jgi:hypothetical protein